MDRSRRTWGIWRKVAMALSVLAITLKILTPSGFMPADQGSGFPLVICTGQGAMVLTDPGDQTAPGDDGSGEAGEHPCAFATTATATLTPNPTVISGPAVYSNQALTLRVFAQRPDLGLAAPPATKNGPTPVNLTTV